MTQYDFLITGISIGMPLGSICVIIGFGIADLIFELTESSIISRSYRGLKKIGLSKKSP